MSKQANVERALDGLAPRARPWAREAACTEAPDPFLVSMDVVANGVSTAEGFVQKWDPEEHEGLGLAVEEAVEVCKRCPVLDQCREWALSEGEGFGVWGGLTPAERESVAALAKRAARRAKASKRE